MTIGIDLGDRKSYFCVLNDQAQVIARGFLPTTITAFRREFEGLPPSLVMIEAGAHSLWANQVLKVCGHEVLVGNPRKIRLITESDRKSDRVDAESLARLHSRLRHLAPTATPPQEKRRASERRTKIARFHAKGGRGGSAFSHTSKLVSQSGLDFRGTLAQHRVDL
jgi:transposase